MTTLSVRHDAPIEVTVKAGRRVLSQEVVEARLVDAHLTVQSYMRGGAFNGVDWRDNDGRLLAGPPKVSLRLTDPAFELRDGELCACSECVS